MEALLMTGRRGLRGLAVMGEHGGVALDGDEGRCLGDCGHAGLVAMETVSPLTICLRFARSTFCVSGSLSHLKNNSSTLSFNTGFNAMLDTRQFTYTLSPQSILIALQYWFQLQFYNSCN